MTEFSNEALTATSASYYSTGTLPRTGTASALSLPTEEGLEIFITAICLVLTVLTIIGNSMALSVFYRIPVKSARGPVRKNVSVAFFMSMAIADLANGLIVMPLSLYAICNNRLFGGDRFPGFDNFCTFAGVTNNLTSKAALFILVLISMDRFIAVYDALRKDMILTLKRSILLIACGWCCAMLLALVPFFFRNANQRYYYFYPELQCNWNPYDLFNIQETKAYMDVNDSRLPPKIIVMFFFTVMLPIIASTLLIVFFCISVALSLRKHMEISKKLKATQMLEKKDSTRRLRNSMRNSTVIRSFKRKQADKPVTIKMDKVEAGYTEIGSGTAQDEMQGQVVLRRKSRQIANRMCSPRTARDRWSQMSIRSNMGKKTKVDQQQKAIGTVIIMLLFCVLCHGVSWIHLIDQFLVANQWTKSGFMSGLSVKAQYYILTMNVLLRYINSAGNPFLYYFRMLQFKKEVSDIMASINGTTNRVYTSIRTGESINSRTVRHFP